MADLNLQVKVLQGDAEKQLDSIIKNLEKKKINLKINIKGKQLESLSKELESVYKNAKKAADALNKPANNNRNSAFEASKKMLQKLRAEEAKLEEMYNVGNGRLHHTQTKAIEKQLNSVRSEIAKNEKAMENYASKSGNLSKKAIQDHANMMASSQEAINKSVLIDNKYGSKVSTFKEQIKEVEELESKSKELNKTLTATESVLTSRDKSLKSAFGKNRDINLDEFKQLSIEAQKYQQQYEQLIIKSNELRSKMAAGTATKQDILDAEKLKVSMQQLSTNMDNVQKRMEHLVSPIRNAQNEAVAFDKIGSRLTDYYNKYEHQLRKNVDLYKQWEDLVYRTGKGDFASVADANRQFAAFRTQCRAAGIEVETFGTKLQKAFGSKLRGQLSYYGFTAIEMTLRDIVQNAIAVDTAMTELKKVTSETDAVYTQFLEGAEARAQKLGATLSEVVNATADYARLGYNIEQSTILADSALIYSNVGDDVANIDDATSALISTMQGFNIAAEDSMTIVDKFNNVSNNYASSAGDIGEIVRRSAASMSAAGNSLDQTIALGVAANEVQQDADTVGTALKTMSMRLRGSKTDLEAAGLDAEGMASSVSTLRDEIISLSGVDITLNNDTFKSSYDILMGIGEVWDSLSDVNRANITELLFGKRQKNCLNM